MIDLNEGEIARRAFSWKAMREGEQKALLDFADALRSSLAFEYREVDVWVEKAPRPMWRDRLCVSVQGVGGPPSLEFRTDFWPEEWSAGMLRLMARHAAESLNKLWREEGEPSADPR